MTHLTDTRTPSSRFWRPIRALSVALVATLPLSASAEVPLGDSTNWIGADLGIEQVRLQEAGEAYFVQIDATTTTQAETGPDHQPPTTVLPHEPRPEDAAVWHGVDVRNRKGYTAKIPSEDLAFLGAYARRLGLDQGKVGGDGRVDPDIEPGDDGSQGLGITRPTGLATKGWSNDHDSRINLTSTTSYPYRTIGTLYDGGGDCTGSLVGPRHILTAAHCIYNRESETWSYINFKPGRNGEGSAPYGAFSPIWYWVPQQYIDEPFIGGAADGHANNRYDIAVIVLEDSFWSWMGYVALSGNVLDTKTLFMRGYPRCTTAGSPNGCDPKTLWGDVKRCETGQYFNPDPMGWNYEIKTNCDGSAGQSGSSFYYYTNGAVATAGVFSGQYCDGACAGTSNDAWPNIITRITPTYLDVISWFRAAYP